MKQKSKSQKENTMNASILQVFSKASNNLFQNQLNHFNFALLNKVNYGSSRVVRKRAAPNYFICIKLTNNQVYLLSIKFIYFQII